LTVKLLLVVFYIVLGVFALRHGRSKRVRGTCFAVALLTYLAVIGIAVAHHPLGWSCLRSTGAERLRAIQQRIASMVAGLDPGQCAVHRRAVACRHPP
jgi:peptidoglycan/LPS O-acetylase OafA/YrhL